MLHLGKSPLSAAVLARLRTEFDRSEVGDNEPYRMDATDYTVPRHAVSNGLDYLELEVRQDLLADPVARMKLADMLTPGLLGALADVA